MVRCDPVDRLSVDLSRAAVDLNLDRRLRDIPASARTRGIFFNLLRDNLDRRHLLDTVPEARRVLKSSRRSYRFYSTREMIEACAICGALADSDPREGMRSLFMGSAQYFASTWYGQALARFFHPSPVGALGWIERSREHFANYGKWRLELRGPGHAILHMFDEYMWIEAVHRGGCEGMLIACGVPGEVTADLDDDYNGRLVIRWQARS
jgi:uncharacterized protein (TIGR02265 family)